MSDNTITVEIEIVYRNEVLHADGMDDDLGAANLAVAMISGSGVITSAKLVAYSYVTRLEIRDEEVV